MDLLRSLEKKIVVGSFTALSLLLIIGLVPLLSIQRLVSSVEEVRSVQASVVNLEAILSHMKDAESGTRGFFITGNTEFLDPYQSAIQQLSHDLTVLPGTLHASTNITDHLPRLNSLINQKLVLSQQIIEERKKEEFLQASHLQHIEESKRLMDQIRVLISQMQTQERNLLTLREKQNNQVINLTITVILAVSVLAIVSVVLSVIFIRRDVIKRRQAEEKLLNSEQLLNDAQHIAKMGSWEYHLDQDKLSVSDTLYQIFEIDSSTNRLENSGQFYQYVHPDDVKQLQEEMNNCLLTGEGFQAEYRLLLPEGKQKHILSYVNPVKENDAKIRKVRGTCQDITELKYAQEALVHSETLFSTIFRLTPFPTAITRLSDGKIIVANNKALQVFGYSALELSSLTTIDLKLWTDKEDREQLVQLVRQQPIVEFEKRYRSKDGKEWDAITYIEVTEWDQEPCLLVILQDITERKKAETAIKDYADQLKKMNVSKDKFFSIIAHDLLSPLNGVLGSANLLSSHFNTLSEEEIKKLSQGIHASTTHLKRLLSNLLEWARMQRGELSFNPKEVDLRKLAVEEAALLHDNALQKEITIDIAIQEDQCLKADEHMLRSVLRNLIANAVKFSNKGDRIVVSCEPTDKEVIVHVKDTGIGMSKDVQERLFQLDVKHTSIGTGGEKGTALGLVLCKEFVERHGGRIWVESEERKGTIFSFTLPR